MAQDLVQSSFECLLGWKWHGFSGQPVLVLNCPHGENYLLLSELISPAAVHAHCLSSYQHAPCRSVWLPLLSCGEQKHLPLAFSSRDWTNPALTVSPQTSRAPAPSPPWWPSAGLAPVCQWISWTGEPQSDTVLQLWFHKCGIIEKNDLSWPAGYTLANTFGLCHSGILLPHVQLQVHQDTHSLNSVGPSISPRRIPLIVTCHQMDFCTADPNILSQAVQTIFHPLYCHLSCPYLTFLQRHSEDFGVFLRCFESYSPSVKKTTINLDRNVFVMFFSECLTLQINWVFVYKFYLYLYQVGSVDLGLKTF